MDGWMMYMGEDWMVVMNEEGNNGWCVDWLI